MSHSGRFDPDPAVAGGLRPGSLVCVAAGAPETTGAGGDAPNVAFGAPSMPPPPPSTKALRATVPIQRTQRHIGCAPCRQWRSRHLDHDLPERDEHPDPNRPAPPPVGSQMPVLPNTRDRPPSSVR